MTKWGPTGQAVYERTYARDLPDGSKETWPQTVDRVIRGNLNLVDPHLIEPGEEEALRDHLLNFKALPAGRHLWTSGASGRQFNRNCHRAGWGPKLSDHFTFTFDELMKGGGVGANYSSEYLADLPPVRGKVLPVIYVDENHPDAHEVPSTPQLYSDFTIRVEDSREGWVEALGVLIDAYVLQGTTIITFDLSDVRPRGSAIRGFGGTASGPGPLAEALLAVASRLNTLKGGHLTPLDAMSIDHALAACVVAGNVRRSARMSTLVWSDPHIFDFINCKADHTDHWSTNISVEVDESFFLALSVNDYHATAVFNAVTEAMLRNGEPGFYNSSLASNGEYGDVRSTNPCGEMPLEEWEACNLAHVNLAAFAGRPYEAAEAFRLMTRFAVRATCAELLNPRQAEVEARNRRIGVGFFGFQEWLGGLGLRYSEAPRDETVRDILSNYRQVVESEARTYAAEIGIPAPIKHTTIAPTGTVAKLPGVTEGIHPVYALYYERRVRYAANDPALAKLDPQVSVEDCIYSAGTKVAVFPTRDSILDNLPLDMVEQADELSPDTLLGVQRLVQESYADNAVSFTLNVPPSLDVEDLRDALRRHLPYLKGTTVMVDESRPQSPYTRMDRATYERSAFQEVGQSFDSCSTGACPVR